MSDVMWPVRAESERERWEVTPLIRVGPLRFGMTPGEVTVALGRGPTASGTGFAHYSYPDQRIWGNMLVAYYRPASEDEVPPEEPRSCPTWRTAGSCSRCSPRRTSVLAAVAVDARNGPQVRWDGLALTGRVPSTTDDAIYARLRNRDPDTEIRISQEGTYSYEDVGILLRVQRAGDILLTRPVFAAPEWIAGLGDTSEGPLPHTEWDID
ncbi:hypothetical protein [Embleya sp. NPDC059237]|uniref:hypothetical protein n=1 Tax=Embleya sp. NPDC059237 TaxID=3346784 RepID=UPI0036862D11